MKQTRLWNQEFVKKLKACEQVQYPLTHLCRKKCVIQGARVVFRSIHGLHQETIHSVFKLEEFNIHYQVLVSLYDVTYRQFFGRQWKGPRVAARGDKLQYSKSVYFHTSINNVSVIAVVEVVAHTVAADGRPHTVSCGWGFLRPFSPDGEVPDSSRGAIPQRIPLYYGTPRALYFLDDPIENNPLLKTIEKCELSCSVVSHKVLRGIMHLLPENTLVDSNDVIPGIVDSHGPDKLKRPELLRLVPIVIDGLVIQLQPNVEKFEAELCELMTEDRALRENRQADNMQISIVERRLQVGVHNGWCYIDKPTVYHLEKQTGNMSKKPTASPTVRRSSKFHIRRNSTGSSTAGTNASAVLMLKSKIEIPDLPEDPLCAVVFDLEYVIGEPLSALDRKQTHSLTRAYTRTVNIRWAAWAPLIDPHTEEVHVALMGGPLRSPDDALVYKIPTTALQNEQTSAGVIAFRWAKDGEAISAGPVTLAVPTYRPQGSAVSVRSDVSESLMYETGAAGDYPSRKPPSWKNSMHRQSVISTKSHQSLPAITVSNSAAYIQNGSSESPYYQEDFELLMDTDQGTCSPFSKNNPYIQKQSTLPPQVPVVAMNANPIPQYMFPMPAMTVAQQQMMSVSSMYPNMYTPTNGLYPVDIRHMQETSAATELRDLPFTPVHALVLAEGSHPKGGRGLSRAAYARLYAAGFPPLLDRNGDPPEVIDPHGQHLVSLAREQMDPLQANEVIFQFLAFTREPILDIKAAQGAVQPSTVFFTFQFYRFPQVTTERMLLSKPQNDLSSHPSAMPFVLQRLNPDGSIMEGPPGLEVKYPIDPTFLKPGEISLFWKHLYRQTMHIDVWDGDSLLLIGSCSVELKYLFRGGNEAVQTTFELDVLATEYQEDSGALTGEIVRGGSIRPVGVNCLNRGRLHFRIANIGYPVDKKKSADLIPVASKTQVIVSQTAGNSSYKGGSLTTVIPPTGTRKVRVARAKHLAENSEVASLLFSEQRKLEGLGDEEVMPREGDAERQRKLARLQAVKAIEQNEDDNKAVTTIIGYRKEKTERTRDFKTMDIYRNQTKREGIINMLSTSITTEHTIFPSFGTVEFFEFVLRNPFNQETTVTIEINDQELFLVTDAREWRHYKQLCQLTTPIEEGMFTSASSDQSKPQIFLRAKEQVNIPLKFQTFKTDMSVQPQGPSNPFNKNTRQSQQDKSLESRIIRVAFRSEEGKAVAILNVRVEPQPHVVDQTFRFHHPENSFLKKSVRLPPFQTLPGGPVGGAGLSQVFVRCSDPNVILDCKPTQPGEPHDIFMKVALGASPQIKRFFVCAYIDPYLSQPAQIWQCYVHALQRVDVTCVEGQTSRLALLLRGTQASRVVKCFTSHPLELKIAPEEPFILAAGTVHELNVAVRPIRTGSKFFYINVVDIEYHQLVRSWLLCASCRSPIVSRAFELTLPVGGGRNSSKRITYTNPYPVTKRFQLLCDRPDLLHFKESLLEIEGGGSRPICLQFLPVMQPGVLEIMVFINDEEDKNEETFRVTATYKFL